MLRTLGERSLLGHCHGV